MVENDPSEAIAGATQEELDALQRAYEKSHQEGTLARIDLEQKLRQDARRNKEKPKGNHP
jgi:hypothetical protein